jgi:hypothetical protein
MNFFAARKGNKSVGNEKGAKFLMRIQIEVRIQRISQIGTDFLKSNA